MVVEVGQRWRRREPQGDDWDHIVIRGFMENEPTVSPVAFGAVIACSLDSLVEHYTRVADDPAAEIADRVAALEAS